MNGKIGLDYFSLDVDFFQDEKIQFVSARFGTKGEAITIRLLCKIYRQGYFLDWNDDMALLLAKSVGDGCQHSLVRDVVHELLKRGFFDKSIFERFAVLTSRGIQERYFEATIRRKFVGYERDFILIDLSRYPNARPFLRNADNSSQNVNILAENVDILKQSKGKESKYKHSPHGECSSGDEKEADSHVSNERGRSLKIDYPSLVQTFHSLCPSLPKIKEITEKRRGKLRIFLKNNGNDKKRLLELFKKTESSDYLTGRNGKWTACGFDWILEYNNAVKILEGNYDNERTPVIASNTQPPPKRNRFVNYSQREWDYEKLEQMEQALLLQSAQEPQEDEGGTS